LESMFHWLSDDTVRFKSEVGVSEKCTKMQNGFSAYATARRTAMSADDVIIVGTYITREACMKMCRRMHDNIIVYLVDICTL